MVDDRDLLGLGLVEHVVAAQHQNDRGLRKGRYLPEPPREGVSVDAGKVDISEHDVGSDSRPASLSAVSPSLTHTTS